MPTAAIVVEIASPDDETWDKLAFYASRAVDEILIVSAEGSNVSWLMLQDGQYVPAGSSRLLGPASASLADQIDWPTNLATDQPT